MGAESEGAGYIAAKGLPTTKAKRYAELAAELRTHDKGSTKHRETRWEMYKLTEGGLPREQWDNVYDANLERAIKANEIVSAERSKIGWGKVEQTIELGKGEVRRLDVADVARKKGMEIKAYEGPDGSTGYISASVEIVSELNRDALLVKRGWEITWRLIDTEPSKPLLDLLVKAKIKVEVVQRKGRTRDYITRYN
jgi:hypothetical protein